jgi:Glycosyl transferase family 2
VSNTKPFFSVVIPTTRPHYLKYSLGSMLAQTFEDFEVIIAFNRKPGGQELGRLPDDPRIKVVEAETFLPMHENWERGFRQIRGEWALLLGDDDCLISHALEIISAKIAENPCPEMILWRWGGFVVPEWPSSDRGRISIPSFTGKVEKRSSESVEELLYGFDPERTGEMKRWLPSIMRGAVRAEVVRKAQERTGWFCHPLTPDYGAAAQIVMLTDQICLLDLPLLILNHPLDSMTASSASPVDVRASQFYDLVGNPRFGYTLVQTRHESNRPVIGETLMSVRAKYRPDTATKYNPSQFLEWHMAGLVEARAKGRDTAAAEAETDAAIDTLSGADRDLTRGKRITVTKANLRWRRHILRAIQQLLMGVPVFNPLFVSLARRYGIDVFGPKVGIVEISTFTDFVDRLVSRSQAQRERLGV